MKKLIGTVSFAMVMGCALALANANDDVNSNTNSGTSDMSNQSSTVHQEPGTAADTNTVNGNTAPDDHVGIQSETTTTTTTSKTAMNKKSCTDANGKLILKGHTGYTACMKHKKAQMGGIADDSVNKEGNNLDANHVDNGTNDTNSGSYNK
jgi:hypothetical protein